MQLSRFLKMTPPNPTAMTTRIETLCLRMQALHASDLFLGAGRVPAMRQTGAVTSVPAEPPLAAEDFQAFCEASLPEGAWARFERERDLDLGVDLGGDRFRLNLSFQSGAPAMAVRRVPSGDLDFAPLHIPDAVRALAEAPRGLILVTGATGSGKSTTLAAMLNHINAHFRRHIVTLEDPIEFVHRDRLCVVSQREIGGDTRDFATALAHVVRQNPDAIFIGEIRDRDTIETALSAAMTGHLVCATFHTVDVEQTVERILNFYPEEMRAQAAADFALALQGIVAQRLLPAADGQGRVPAFEILLGTPLVSRLIARREISRLRDVIKENAALGMVDFSHSLLELCRTHAVTPDVAASAATNRDEFLLLLQGMETGAGTFRVNAEEETSVSGFNLKRLLRNSISYGASDLLLTADAPPTVRIDGVLRPYDMPLLKPADTRQLLFSVLSGTQRAEFENTREIDFALSVTAPDSQSGQEQEYRFRVNGFYQKGRIAVALRLIPTRIPTPEELGLPASLVNLTKRRQGLVLVTGPTGHGKSTTLAALIDRINATRPCHIITIEDPIEFVHRHQQALVEQREVGADTHSFANALKYVLREDPDVIMVGEMRDAETIGAALTAAETGHLVFATLHTNDVCQTVDRIIDVFPPAQQGQVRAQLAASLECIVAQRLLPRADTDGGRIAVFEVLIGTTPVRALIRDNKTHLLPSTIETGAKDGMITMDRALQLLFEAGKITRETFRSIASIQAAR